MATRDSLIETDLSGYVPTTRQIISGSGLTGGGTLAADRTLAVGAGDGITVNADDVAVKVSDIVGTGLQATGNDLGVKAEVLTNAGGDRVQDAAASTATGERVIHINEMGVTQTVASVDLVNSTTLAGNDTNNFTMTIRRRNSAGTAATIVAYTNNVASGGITAWIIKNLGALANTAIAAGECITLEVTKAGTGQALLCRVEIKLTTPG